MRLMRFACVVFGLFIASPVFAKMVAEPVDWKLDGTTFKSVLVYDDAVTTKRPGLVMVPNWYGVNDIAVKKAEMVAGKDYVILLTDMYGAGVRPKTDDDARAAVAPLYHDRGLMRARIGKAFDENEARPREYLRRKAGQARACRPRSTHPRWRARAEPTAAAGT